ncbi:MAG: hypothetical protein K6F06_01525 [Bacteroidales bacterium]|nr:hypothetical protein [Bacteroidales bacterium]
MKKSVMIALTAIMALFVACGPKEDPIESTPANVPVSGSCPCPAGRSRQDLEGSNRGKVDPSLRSG